MNIVKCPQGHSYDSSIYSRCPFCNGTQSIGTTVLLGAERGNNGNPVNSNPVNGNPQSMNDVNQDNIGPTRPSPNNMNTDGIAPTQPINNYQSSKGRTINVCVNDQGIVPVAGWLVCIEGEKKGLSFPICGDKTKVGRGAHNNINLYFDQSITSSGSMIIVYDSMNNDFYISMGTNQTNNAYLNNHIILSAAEKLNDYDVIAIANTKLMFRSFCNDKFSWSK